MSLFLDIPGGPRLAYSDEGTGAALLFIHGWTCDSADFEAQIAHFRTRYRVITTDLRGHGQSSECSGYDARDFAGDLIVLLDHLKIASCVAVGHSLGGMIASVLAADYSQRIDAAICLDPAYGVDGAALAGCRDLIAMMEGPGWPEKLAAEFDAWEGPATQAHARARHKARVLTTAPHVVRETFVRLFGAPDSLGPLPATEAAFENRRCPVLAIYASGHEDRIAWERARSRNARDRFMIIPGGHWIQEDAADAVNQAMEAWLTAISF